MMKSSPKARVAPREGFGGLKPLPFELKAMLLLDNVVRQLPGGKIHSGSNQ